MERIRIQRMCLVASVTALILLQHCVVSSLRDFSSRKASFLESYSEIPRDIESLKKDVMINVKTSSQNRSSVPIMPVTKLAPKVLSQVNDTDLSSNSDEIYDAIDAHEQRQLQDNIMEDAEASQEGYQKGIKASKKEPQIIEKPEKSDIHSFQVLEGTKSDEKLGPKNNPNDQEEKSEPSIEATNKQEKAVKKVLEKADKEIHKAEKQKSTESSMEEQQGDAIAEIPKTRKSSFYHA